MASAILSLTGKIAHFELGYIPDSAKELQPRRFPHHQRRPQTHHHAAASLAETECV
jgi:hypothetical protein